jgi:hypothetical protein
LLDEKKEYKKVVNPTGALEGQGGDPGILIFTLEILRGNSFKDKRLQMKHPMKEKFFASSMLTVHSVLPLLCPSCVERLN